MPTDEETIRALLKRRDADVRAGDAAAVAAVTAPGAVTYDLPPPLRYVHDVAGATEGLTAWFDTWEGPVSSDLADPAIRISGDLALAHGLANMRGDKKGEGPTDVWFRATIVLARHGDTWRIVHEHNSFPLNMDGSGTAATGLKPD